MAGHLMRLPICLLAAAASISCAWAQGGALPDPTRPPAAYLAPGTGDAVPVAAPLSRLSSVMLPKRGGRASAVIDGQLLRVGDTLGEARLLSVSETAAVLEGPQGRETLYLIPDVNKTPAARLQGGRPSAKEKR